MKTNDEIRRDNLLLAIAKFRTAASLAEAAGTSAAYLSQIKRQTPDSKTGKPKGMGDDLARNIERAIGEPEGWMDADHNSSTPDTPISELKTEVIVKSAAGRGNTMGLSNTEPAFAIRGRVPLISWDQARTWDPSMNSFNDKDALGWIACPVEHGAATFCIENNTETMDDGTRDGYGEGEVLFVDPEVPAVPNKDIIVILPNGKTQFRRLKEDSEGRYLLALNGKRIERWEEGTTIRGVVIFSGKPR
jgi:SOS-response transcriptional repressor LexA